MIQLEKIKCVGCFSCSSVCPIEIIRMESNFEGFKYPIIIDDDKCIRCNLCEKVCPVINNEREIQKDQIGLISQITDSTIRKESASGGMFSAIALSVMNDNGIVYGAAYDENFHVKHIGVTNREELWRLRNSKYVQSDLEGVFKEIKAKLEKGKVVCFSGTPCQIEGLRFFLRKDYENLLLVDVVCHGVSSPLVWEKYLELIKKYKPHKIYFRWKHYGYKYSTMSIFDKDNNEVYFNGVETDKMLKAYFSNNCDRDTCYECIFKKRFRNSDITIWDCFQPSFFDRNFDDDQGTSCVLIHSSKGKRRLEKIINLDLIKYKYVDSNELVLGNNEMINSVKKGNSRDFVFENTINMSGQEFFDKFFPDSSMTKIKKKSRLLLIKTKLYKKIKYIIYKKRRMKARKKNEQL